MLSFSYVIGVNLDLLKQQQLKAVKNSFSCSSR